MYACEMISLFFLNFTVLLYVLFSLTELY